MPEPTAASSPHSGRGAASVGDTSKPVIRARPRTAAVTLPSVARSGRRRDRAASQPAMSTGARPRLTTVAIATPPHATARKYSAW
jgi:hypothetical protein